MSTYEDVEQYKNVFIWKINHFSLFQLEINASISSPLFRTENLFRSTWFMEIYPCGTSFSDSRFASVFLAIKRNDYRIVTCRYAIEIMSADGFVLDSKSNYGEFYRDNREGWNDYVEIEKLQNKAIYFPNDTLLIRCLLYDWALYNSKLTGTVPRKLSHDCSSYMSKLTKTVAETNIGFDRIYFKWLIESLTRCSSKIIECPATSRYLMKLRICNGEIFLSVTKLYKHALRKFALLKILVLGLNGRTHYSNTYRFTLTYNCKIYEFSSIFPSKLPQQDIETLDNGSFTLFGEFSVSNETNTVGTETFFSSSVISLHSSSNEPTLNDLQKSLLLLFVQKKQCDAILNVNGIQFSVHKFILTARSSFFLRIFEENASNYVEITTKVNSQTWLTFLKFLYIGIIDKLDYVTAIELLNLADRYKIFSLKCKCCSFIRHIVSERSSFNNFSSK